jgi:hypothetical protein
MVGISALAYFIASKYLTESFSMTSEVLYNLQSVYIELITLELVKIHSRITQLSV